MYSVRLSMIDGCSIGLDWVLKNDPMSGLLCCVSQASILGPLLFILYTFYLMQLIEWHELAPHLNADDMQVSCSCCPSYASMFPSLISDFLRNVFNCMRLKRLQLDKSKTEVMWCTTKSGASSFCLRVHCRSMSSW